MLLNVSCIGFPSPSIQNYSPQKGALMFNAWRLTSLRPTRDIDLLGHTQNSVESVVTIFQDISNMEVEPDGLEFDTVHVQAQRIKEDAEYEGIRIIMVA
jgi:hypothetical protein